MNSIENSFLKLEIANKGAEIKKIINKKNNQNYIWKGDSNYWGKTAPVLFPFIGGQKNGKFIVEGKEYSQLKHGFARDNDFKIIEKNDTKIKYLFSYSEETLKQYPFKFNFYITYTLEKNRIKTEYLIENIDDKEMYFSIGAHPAFSLFVNEEIKYEDYYLEFEKEEEIKSFIIDGVLLKKEKIDLGKTKILELKKDTFKNDAFVFENLKSKEITLKNKKDNRKVKVIFDEFPYLALWNVVNAEFICIEPWCGINDFVDFNGELKEKIGIEKLDKSAKFKRKLIFEIV
ncbi:galactose mutarotase-like enzyme [Hypnocyclicus thermotrophus]|uniref:Galactose mutarotase-like enzyme n=1 Tax=Hypnocyclicus thermotrophus TaxID=1627895 RepID=A0AA46I5N1_9FUSO|nr:aldose 1-epimerase family protein [Hypnocyclicus thermotrophus]TDT70508.1 galactose mutarotase-like enzyme [Hypnocyclicus thermotrophus]